MRSELTAALAQLPDAADVEWRSDAQRRCRARLDDIRSTVDDALKALDYAAIAFRDAAILDSATGAGARVSTSPAGSDG
ncbi:hypothetical protein HII28_11405 [Planctomonas sp. JC2975]|uniref:hypothetical protein n=1 Tax=Planctomonas sp. JC2975 TaxID=2729626 RepID=UPI0014748F6F|nr:hypothetical protein [Planctomonas sp. JC2975]NNC12481.1 hypothetical protein [Planctomonas sp. JC2975]